MIYNIYNYEWGHELRRMEEERKVRFPDQEVYHTPEGAVTPIANIIALAKAARNQPEISQMVHNLIEEEKKDPDYQDKSSAEVNFFGFFKCWYWLKYDLMNDDSMAYLGCMSLVKKWALGLIDEDDEQSARRFILSVPVGKIVERVS